MPVERKEFGLLMQRTAMARLALVEIVSESCLYL